MKIGNGYALWLMPDENTSNIFKNEIVFLSKKYGSPHFDPHLTLLGDIKLDETELIDKTKLIASNFGKISIKIKELDYSDKYFKSIFFNIELNQQLNEMNSFTKKLFRIESQEEYKPHVSLLYGNIKNLDKIQYVRNFKNTNTWNFEVNSIRINYDFGEVKDWYEIKSFSLV